MDRMVINGFVLDNVDKVRRVIEGTVGRAGAAVGGLGLDADPGAILAAYDRIGGLVLKDGNKVQTGAFWDFKENKQRETPVVSLVYRVNGQEILVPAGQAEPLAVQAAKLADKAVAEAKPKKAKADAKK